MPGMLCAVNTSVSEMTSRAECVCISGCLHFVHGSVCRYNCVCSGFLHNVSVLIKLLYVWLRVFSWIVSLGCLLKETFVNM